jgi:phospholipid/cholesterol/gamma-HCH transport system ATP-binding protein
VSRTEANSPQLELSHVGVKFGDVVAVEDISFDVKRGDVVVIIGGSGAGKTTLLKTLIGLVRPTSGVVRFEGQDLAALNPAGLLATRKKLGMLFQHAALLDSLDVLDNVALPLKEHTRLSPKEIETRVLDKLAALDLHGVERRFPAELSGGMKKRVGLARALILDPSVLLYDEPTSGLDPLTARLVDEMILKTRDRFGVTSVVISHDMVQALAIADQLHLIDHGRLVASGTPEEMRNSVGGLAQRFFEASGISTSHAGSTARAARLEA